MSTMKHAHSGDPMKLCRRCIPELEHEIRRIRFWRRTLLALLIVLAIGCMAMLSLALNKYGSHLG